MKKKRMMICGRNTNTLPTPASTPSTSSPLNRLCGHGLPEPTCEGIDPGLDGIHRHLRPRKYGLKYEKENDREDQRARHGVQHDGIQLVAEGHPVDADRPRPP